MIMWHLSAFRPAIDCIDIHMQLTGLRIPYFQVICVEEQLADYVFLEIIYVDHEE